MKMLFLALSLIFSTYTFCQLREGFNPDEVSDPLYLADNDNSTFIKLDTNLYQKLMNQKIRL